MATVAATTDQRDFLSQKELGITMSSPDTTDDAMVNFSASLLGTKEYWDQIYERDMTLFHDHGDNGEIWFGTDYSEAAINLAATCWSHVPSIKWSRLDFLCTDSVKEQFPSVFDLVIDKGTFDAMTLADGINLDQILHQYKASLFACLRPNTGRFILTSCNWTLNELKCMFTSESHAGFHFTVQECIQHAPGFVFQGKSGQMVTSVVFQHGSIV